MQTELEQYIDTKVTRGEFSSSDEFVEAAITMYRDLEELDELRNEVGRRIEQARAGRVAPLDIADLKSRLLTKWQTQDQSAS
jgi:Arc/MetJ-type ribon-helix-helix transcriptional regulator